MFANALWNILAGISAAILGIALPPFLTRWLPPETFGAWSLCLQIATYVNILNLGIQVIVAKLVADTTARGDFAARNRVVNTAIAVLSVGAMVGLAVMAYVCVHIARLIPRLAPNLVADVQICLLLLALAFCLMLPLSVFGAVFIGIRDNRTYAFGLIVSRAISYVLILGACFITRDIRWMGVQYLLAALLTGGYWYSRWRTRTEAPRLAFMDLSRLTAGMILRDAATLSVWNVSMMMVTGLQVVIVSRLDYPELPYFAAAATLTTFVSGMLAAICGTIVPQAARLSALDDRSGLRVILFDFTRLTTLISSIATIPLILVGSRIMYLWVGAAYATHAALPAAILALGYSIRNVLAAFAMMTVGLGRQNRLLAVPLLEGVVSLAAGIVLGSRFGASGVAAGMLVGAFVNIIPQLRLNLLADILGPVGVMTFVRQQIVRPFSGIGLAVAFWGLNAMLPAPPMYQAAEVVLCIALSCLTGSKASDFNFVYGRIKAKIIPS